MTTFRKRIIKSTLLSSVILFTALAPALAALDPIPASRAPFRQLDNFQTDLFSGSANYSYPIKVPKGTDDLTPDVALSYNSHGARDIKTYLGSGWQLNYDYVERDVNFTVDNTADDKFKLYFKGAAYDLVYVSGDSRYHTNIESNLHITKLTSGEANDSNEYWQVITPDGTKYRFGQSTASELVCTGTGSQSFAHQWYLDLVTDIHDNKITYTYTEDQAEGMSYISQITYNNDDDRIIDFNYTSNPYEHRVFYQGCYKLDNSRLNNIRTKINSSLIREYDITFDTSENTQPLVGSITEKGSDGSSLPATTFEYKPEIESFDTSSDTWVTTSEDINLTQSNVVIVDINGDGLNDLVKSTANSTPNVTWNVLLNTGNGFETSWHSPKWANNVNLDDARMERSDVRIVDVTGDNLPDVVMAAGANSWKAYQNNGSTFSTTATFQTNFSSISSSINLGSSSTELVDVTGDGRADVVRTWWDGSMKYEVYKNTGSNWSTTVDVWKHNDSNLTQGLDDTKVRIIDVNGDGLADIVRTSYSGANSKYYVYPNTGDGWGSRQTWFDNGSAEVNFDRTDTALSDVNGDGLPDIVKSVDSGGSDTWRVWINKGSSWSNTSKEWISSSSNVDTSLQSTTQMADVTGDGMADIVRGQWDGGANVFKVWKSNGVNPDLLDTVNTAQGGEITFDYLNSVTVDNTGADSLSDLPFSLWLVESMTVSNGMAGAHATTNETTYSYKDGAYDSGDKEFRGFAEVNTTEPNGSKKKYVFNQDDALKGRLEEVQHKNSSNDPFQETDNTWSSSTSNGVTTVKLDSEQFITYDATTSGSKTIQNDYTYDSYGNVTKKSEKGDTSISTDDRFIYNEYTYNTTAWIVNTAKHTYTNKSDDSTKVNESWFFYDGNIFWTSAPTKGDLTKKEDWLSGGTNPITQYAYDTYGNQTSVTDANSHTTSTAYDTATHTYPISMTNAKSQTTTVSYDLGTGNLLSSTDPNGNITSYTYDVFGRITKEIKPYDSSSNPTTKYSYILDGIAPEGTLISKLETSSSSAILDTYTFNDGLGRKVQTRFDAEDSNKQRIIDTFYDQTGEIKKETVPYLASSSAIAPTNAPAPSKFGDGSDGNITISSNTTENPIDSAVSAIVGGNTASVGANLGFAQNQIVLFHQTQGTNAGVWEYARVYSYSGTSLILTTPLTNSYRNSGSNKAQVRVVPQYQNVTVNSGVTWTAKAWDGSKGGIFAFLANGTVTVTGTISANGKGFVGGTVTAFVDGHQGEGTTGAAGAISSAANANGGGGNISPKGAGGGGNGTAGTSVSGGGTGGSMAGTADLTAMVLGGGGGSGDDVSSGSGGNNYGGNGGGNLFISGANISVTGNITANGNNGGVPNGGTHGGGGGGAGGSVLLKSQTATLSASLVTSSAGSGGNGTGSGTAGGNGGVGRIRVEYENSLTGTTNPSASTAQVTIPYLPSSTPDYGTYASPDASAKYTEFTYDPIGRPTIITNTKGDNKTIAYDHWKETTIDENGHIKREFKNAFDKIWKVEEVNGVNTYTTTYEYDSRDLLTKITDHSSNESTFAYDSLGRKTSQVDPDMGTWSYVYDGVGNLTSQTDNRSVTTSRSYDELDRVTLVNYPTQTDTTFAYDIGKIGTLSIATDSAGTVNYSYDNRLRKTQEQRSINGTAKTTQFSYDAMDRTKTQTYPDGEVVTFSFNNQGEIETATGSATLLSNIDYNALGKITSKAFGNGLSTTYTYNTNDFRLNRIQTGSLQDLNYSYDTVGNVASRVNNVTSKTELFSYDDLDRLKTASESAGYNYAYDYNAIGNLTKFTNAGIDIDYTYGSGSAMPHALTSSTEIATSSARPPTFAENWSSGSINGSYWNDWGGAQTSVVSQELKIDSTTSANYYGVELVTDYDLTGSYVTHQLVNAGNQSLTSWEIDPIYVGDATLTNAVFVIVLNNNLWVQKRVNNVDTYYDKGAYNSSTHQYFRIRESGGNMYFDTSANGTTWSNLHSFANPFDLTSMTIGMAAGTYQSEGSTTNARLDNFVYSTVPTSELTDEWTSIDTAKWTDWGGAQTSIVSNQLKIDSTTSANYYGLDSVATYDLTESQVTTQLVNAGNQSLTSWEIDPIFIGNGDLSNAVFVIVLNNTLWVQKRVNNVDTYDNKGAYNSSTHKYFRIRESGGTTYVDTSVDGKNWSNLDSFANLFDLRHVKVGVAAGTYQAEGSTTSVTFDNLNILPSGMTYTYDANGNMTSDGTNCYQYNNANQLDKVTKCSNSQTVAEYVYDYNGNRMVKRNFTGGNQLNSVVSWSDAFETTVATSGAQLTSASYYFANGQLIAKKDNSGNRTYFHNDHLGSTSVVSSQSGALVESTTYDPWGEVAIGGTASKFLYTGQEYDSESKLHYYNARYYDPHIRRFTQPDSFIQNIYDPQMLNRYSYVRNNPLKYTDPTGHWAWLDKAISTVKDAITKIISPKPAPKPASTAKLPNNIPNTSINLSSRSGGNPTIPGKDTAIGKHFTNVVNNGHIDTGVSVARGISVGGGIKSDKNGRTQYASLGGPGMGVGGSVLFSTKPVKQHSISNNININLVIAAQFSYDPLDPANLEKIKYEAAGVGCCGIDLSMEHTGRTYPYPKDISTEMNFRSRNLEEFYGR